MADGTVHPAPLTGERCVVLQGARGARGTLAHKRTGRALQRPK